MGLFGGRSAVEVRAEQKWDYISLKDFKSNSGFAVAAYIYLYISVLISLAVYGVDSFTAVSLLAFGKWTSSIDANKIIDFTIQKWIFSVCIIASFVNLGYEHFRAWRVMKRGSVAECYLDNLAVKMESTRMGSGQGWRRFLVFAELTKSKKGAEYVALFTYFSFQSWIRVILCSGPRQFVNAITIYAVFKSDDFLTDKGSADQSIMNFFTKVGALANENYQQAVVLSGMVFTLIIWVFSALSLLLGAIFYIFFLWHYIPKQDGGLSGYCGRKINKRLMRIVAKKVNKAIAEEERQRARAEFKAAKKAGEKPPVGRQATLPTIPNLEPKKDDSLPDMPMLNRNDTMATLPVYTSRPGSPGGIEMNPLPQQRPMPQRAGTSNTFMSQSSYSSNAPLMGSAAGMGYDRSASPEPTLPQIDLNNYPPFRPNTSQSNRSFGQGPSLHRVQTSNGSNFGAQYAQSPSAYQSDQMPVMPLPVRAPTVGSMDSYGPPGPRPMNQFGSGPRPMPSGRPVFDDGMSGRASPAPSNFSYRPGPGPSRPLYEDGMNGRASPAPSNFAGHPGPGSGPARSTYDDGMSGRGSPAPSNFSSRGPPMNRPGFNGGPMSPIRSATGPVYLPNRPQLPPQRNMTAPMPPRPDDYINRPGTATSQRTMPMPRPGPGPGYGYNDDIESQRGPPPRW
ncbi:hypothetical protein BKA67DRAFT_662395 [Truncatella angustata]|uniref:Vacuolar membrane protein n=1 Tax=Truncatella angustata TaxID=152316 RepID=A0A9P8RQL0_9PEZI|nr:uncharacterized protein BKA67DRAFT_662395 [Truncatella angustata]KAH6647622.1 hypothetical protein BKA67DRAFT_662395 [Truncatella angustata]KAH8204348.1 hypothetical protein TruAng_001511 [Truncatella angustata]